MKYLSLCFVMLVSLAAVAQKSNLNTQAYAGMLDHFHNYVDNGVLAGTVIFLEKNNRTIKDVYGYQNIESKTPMSENSIFRWASMTKPITATAVMILVDEGKLNLDDPVSVYIPEVDKMTIYEGNKLGKTPQNKMTIRQLLSHTSGSTGALHQSNAGRAAAKIISQTIITNLEGLVDLICKTQLAFEPGEGWAYGYSNDLLAYIIEKVSEVPVHQFFAEHIFAPLDMVNTSFQVIDKNAFTSVYAPDDDGILKPVEKANNSRYLGEENFARGNGGLTGTANDYLIFCKMILNNGSYNGKQILKPESLQLMLQNAVEKKYFPLKVAGTEMIGQGYGLGFGVVEELSPFGTKGDVYWPGALYTYFFVSPEHKAAGIFMTQLFDPKRMNLVWEFHDLATKVLE